MAKKLHVPSQNQRILRYLDTHQSITSLDAQREFGCMRLAARIADLEERGHSFTRKAVMTQNRFGQPVRVTAYSLIAEDQR